MIPQVDTYLLNKVQHISDRIQDWSGMDNFAIMKVLAVLCLLLYALRTYFSALAGPDSLGPLAFLMGIVIVSYPFLFFVSAEKLCKNDSGFMNPTVITFARIRSWFLVIAGLVLLMDLPIIFSSVSESKDYYSILSRICFDIKEILYILFLYFGSCTPKPKKPSKIKQFLKKAIENVKSIATGTVSPDPALG